MKTIISVNSIDWQYKNIILPTKEELKILNNKDFNIDLYESKQEILNRIILLKSPTIEELQLCNEFYNNNKPIIDDENEYKFISCIVNINNEIITGEINYLQNDFFDKILIV